jgi:hypothetical protein
MIWMIMRRAAALLSFRPGPDSTCELLLSVNSHMRPPDLEVEWTTAEPRWRYDDVLTRTARMTREGFFAEE